MEKGILAQLLSGHQKQRRDQWEAWDTNFIKEAKWVFYKVNISPMFKVAPLGHGNLSKA